jgi:hypothetical protein
MSNHDLPSDAPKAREVYETPRVLEDLPLESYSLACDPGKTAGGCDLDGLPVTS